MLIDKEKKICSSWWTGLKQKIKDQVRDDQLGRSIVLNLLFHL